MPLIEWTDDMSVGIGEFDSHHKRLIQLLNKMHETHAVGDDQSVIGDVLTELLNYTLYHFFAEEEALLQSGYPDYEQHRHEHLVLTEKTLDFIQLVHSNKTVIGQEVIDFLKDWLKHHILGTDKKYTSALQAKGYF